MEEPDFRKNWTKWREKIREQHPDLTDEELHYEHGKEADLVLRLGNRLKKKKEEIYDWLHMMG